MTCAANEDFRYLIFSSAKRRGTAAGGVRRVRWPHLGMSAITKASIYQTNSLLSRRRTGGTRFIGAHAINA